jgi:hypothetical protein
MPESALLGVLSWGNWTLMRLFLVRRNDLERRTLLGPTTLLLCLQLSRQDPNPVGVLYWENWIIMRRFLVQRNGLMYPLHQGPNLNF